MKAALIALVLTVAGPVHLQLSALGFFVSVPGACLFLTAEAAAFAVAAALAVRSICRSRSAPWWRPEGATS